VSRSRENSRPRKNSSRMIPSSLRIAMPSPSSMMAGPHEPGPRATPAMMKTGIAESFSRPAATLAAARAMTMTARSLSSIRRRLHAVGLAEG
jgi:hypothetical protein